MKRMKVMLNSVATGVALAALSLVAAPHARAAAPAQATYVIQSPASPQAAEPARPAQPAAAPDEPASFVFVRTDDDDGEAREVKVEVVDGEPKVWINGKRIEHDRVRHLDNRLILLDEDGNEIDSIRLWNERDRNRARLRLRPLGGELRGEALVADDRRIDLPGAEPNVMLGIYMDEPGEALRRHLKLKPESSTLITGVYEGLPAHQAGLEEYDIIVKLDGASHAAPPDIRKTLAEREPGDEIELIVIHNGDRRTVSVELTAFDRSKMESARLLGHAPMRERLGNIVVAPSMEGDSEWVPLRQGMDVDRERIERMIHEAIRSAQQHAEEAEVMKKRAEELSKEALHNALVLGDDRIDALSRRMERLEELLDRLQRQLEEEFADDDD